MMRLAMQKKRKHDNNDGFLQETRNVCQHFQTKCQYQKTSKDSGTAIFLLAHGLFNIRRNASVLQRL